MRATKILVVEDDPDIRESLVELLQDHGYEATAASDGRQALEHLRATDDHPSLIMLDLMMPIMDGKAFRDEQLRTPALAAIPVLVISAYQDADVRVSALGSLPLVRKPFDLGELLVAVRALSTPGAARTGDEA